MAKTKSQPVQQASPGLHYVTITIPVCELTDESGYQISKRNPPRELRQRRLSISQGIALAKVRLGMLAIGETMDADTYIGHERVVETKEDCLCRLLELAYAAMTKETR